MIMSQITLGNKGIPTIHMLHTPLYITTLTLSLFLKPVLIIGDETPSQCLSFYPHPQDTCDLSTRRHGRTTMSQWDIPTPAR